MNSSDDELPEIPGTRYPWMSLEKDENVAGPSNAEQVNEAGPSNVSKR